MKENYHNGEVLTTAIAALIVIAVLLGWILYMVWRIWKKKF